jgi:hypothetical protein
MLVDYVDYTALYLRRNTFISNTGKDIRGSIFLFFYFARDKKAYDILAESDDMNERDTWTDSGDDRILQQIALIPPTPLKKKRCNKQAHNQ